MASSPSVELLFVVLIAVGIGLLVNYLVPGRDTYGSSLVPAVAGSAAAIVWVALLWSGVTFDSPFIWLASFVAGALAALAIAIALPRSRRKTEQALQRRLSKA